MRDPNMRRALAMREALADLLEAERRTRERSRLISRDFVRGRLDDTGDAL
ncbi:hypothetical protein [Methylobacterium terrae]|nr:hypothetical protein [Methylobacterium terrae]